jgi:hypothetical protein
MIKSKQIKLIQMMIKEIYSNLFQLINLNKNYKAINNNYY